MPANFAAILHLAEVSLDLVNKAPGGLDPACKGPRGPDPAQANLALLFS